ncbi:E3 ubiquitin-protein ligase UBR2-like isoform X2 [Dreissena polymorpha]|uniref:E3 ubiquitin-protein ligase UBR2-like isoform X2 n=1 Tax=Dreissena polymorpha TaxID=45954 RepID=UPI0022651EE0|nr:E3 ubiquitin-protein ligase UBR2-like isoform X2 [Dreissena polymorpha]
MATKHNLTAPEFNQKSLVEEWLATYFKSDFLKVLKKHWREFVLVVFQSYDDPAHEERLANKFLLHPLEYFLCNGDPEVVFRQLKEVDQPSQLCGHVFKTGEPTYSCRECATDPTCVLCMDCFQASVHKKHRYRMSTSGGGGYCDCGDPEAWKSEVFCENHKPKTGTNNVQNSIEKLPNDLVNRSSAVLLACLGYAVQMLTWDQCDTLPDNLQPEGELSDTYLCMLFNDEVHTYEQVISTLQKAVDCTHKAAVDYATTVDREGRSAVKCGTYAECERVRGQVERNTSRHGSKALKVQVMHSAVVAHQQFALRLIQWLQNIIGQSDGLRQLFCMLSMQHETNAQSLMEMLLLADTQLWKIARVQSHQLMMAGVLMDQECKKRFSIIFTKNYSSLTRDFIQDDHYRTFSVTNITVQIFTVPSLARLLVSEHNLLSVILKTFLETCEEKKKDGKLSFERTSSPTFKRACFSLHDLKYALICKPSPGEWTDQLRRSFLEGYTYFLELLKLMEGMDAVKRQTGQHLEFEPEWEGAFNLQLKLEDNIVLFLDWCASDREVLIQSYNKTVEAFNACKNLDAIKKESCTVAGRQAECLKYDVETQPISIHLPVTRVLAGLHTYLGDHFLSFESTDCHLMRPVAADLLEFPLRVQVMVAQSNANMWRRNGYALINQIFFYHNVKCRTEMYDRDVVMLQIAASMMDNNEYLLQLIHKYKLANWTKEDFDRQTGQEDSLRQTVLLAEEFLSLLIVILGERFIAGVGEVSKEDIVRREVIHQLCISPLAHSELAKALPEDTNHETGLENVVKDVATFKKLSPATGKGRYELKPEFYAYYNPYFYHYTKGDKSKSEEMQVKRRKENNQLQALPPPVPPKFRPMFLPVMGLLQCDIMIYVIELVLARAAEVRSRSLSETQLERVLHLIGMGLHEQKRAIEEGNRQFDFLTRICTPSSLHSKAKKEPGRSIQTLLEKIMSSNNITHDSIRDLVIWTVKTITEVRQMKNEPVAMEKENAMVAPRDVKAEAARRKKQVAAEKRRMKIMAQMSAMQKNFIKENSELFENTSTELFPRIGSDMDISDAGSSSFPVAVGCKQTRPSLSPPQLATCILCQEEQEITLTSKAIVLTAFVQKSTVLSLHHGNALLNGDLFDPLFMRSDLPTGTHTSSCGHMMHAGCWQSFFDNILARERRRPLRFRHNYSHDIEKMEFLCPLCECICNTVIPVLPSVSTLGQESSVDKLQLSFADWLDGIHKTVLNSIREPGSVDSRSRLTVYEVCPLVTITRQMAGSVAQNFQALWAYMSVPTSDVSEETKEMLRKFSRDAYSFGLGVEVDDDNPRVPIMLWNTCAFSLMAIEQQLRDDGKPLFGQLSSRHSDCLRSLVQVASTYTQIVSPNQSNMHCIRLLSFLFPDSFKNKDNEPPMCILDVELFHYLVAIVMSLPSLLRGDAELLKVYQGIGSVPPPGGINHQYALQLVLAVHLIQVLLTFDQENCGMEVDGDYEGEALLILYDHIHTIANVPQQNTPLPWQLSLHVRRSMLPLLRCVALLFHYWTGIPSPAELSDVEGEMKEFDAVCKYLGVNDHMSRLLDNQGEILDSMVNRWCKNSLLKERLSAASQSVVQYPLRINKLIELPYDYSELINKVSTFTCPKSDGDDSRAPTMCLVCGQMLCSQSYCCQTEFEGVTVGAATEHAYKCGAGAGIFLRVRECQILLLAGRTKGCFVPPPYIDDYGETDQGLRRGNPLHLCKDSYAYLQKLWMSHAIPETIAHSLESNATLLTIDWQHL